MSKLLYANTKDSDMLYNVRIEIPDPFFLIEKDGVQYIFLDHRELGVFIEHNKNPHIEAVLVNPLIGEANSQNADPTNGRNKLALFLIKKYVLTDSIDVSSTMPLDMADYLRSKGIVLNVKNPFCPERLVKSPTEVNAIREALRRTHTAFKKIEELLTQSLIVGDEIVYDGVPLTSEFLKLKVEKALLDHDILNMEGIIISCGAHAAIPHHRGAGLIRPHQTIICDIFPRHRASGYFADMTRTYIKGAPSDEQQTLYDAVFEAQEKAIAIVKPGVVLEDVHAVCTETFLKKGYHVGDRGFIHGTGHGLGLDLHEMPFVSKGQKGVMESGHVVTIEPGLYYPEIGGVRIEDVVWVTDDGCENLTQYSKDFIIP